MRNPTAGSLRDRTAEFQAIAERLQKQQGAAPGPSSSSAGAYGHHPAKQAVQQQSEFAKKASQIGLSIHKTSMKLQKLAQLAKRSSMFDDPTAEIDELTGIIKQDIQGLNTAIAELQQVSSKRGENKQSADHSHTVVDNLRTRLKDATQEFKDVLTLRTENMKIHKERKQQYSMQPDSGVMERMPLLSRDHAPGTASSSSSTSRTASSLFGGQVRHRRDTSAAATFTGVHGHAGAGGYMQQQMVQADTYQSSRAEALHNVETTIVELGSIFTQLAEMVAAQGEMAQRIDENVEETMGNVDNAKAQLLKYLNNISNNRWLMLKVFFVLLVFLVVFIVFIA